MFLTFVNDICQFYPIYHPDQCDQLIKQFSHPLLCHAFATSHAYAHFKDEEILADSHYEGDIVVQGHGWQGDITENLRRSKAWYTSCPL